MKDLPTALPSTPNDAYHTSRSARWTTAFVVAVGFGFMGSALIDASEPTNRAASLRTAMVAATAMDIGGPTAGHAENSEVDHAVRNWAWETKSSESKPSGTYDLEELWLAR